jgi:kynurenine 3-monooxygenase
MNNIENRSIWIIGAGLAGALLAVLLTQRGYRVHVSEKRTEAELDTLAPGRSINLALATRGRVALRAAGADLEAAVMKDAIAMFGRHVHMQDGSENFQSYSTSGKQAIYSVHRARLNRTLLRAAREQGAHIYFDEKLLSVDLHGRIATVERDKRVATVGFDLIIGADGAGSILRDAIAALHPEQAAPHVDFLDHSYKEIHIAPKPGSTSFEMRADALHIWPRERFMMIALPNPDFSFTATLFLQNQGAPSFASLNDESAIHGFLDRYFPDFLVRVPDVVQQVKNHPQGLLGTLHCGTWHYQDSAVILGDAAHAIVPFHGQGMNCAFEDCVVLAELLSAKLARSDALTQFAQSRTPQARAIAEMALENYIEMRDHVADDDYRLRKQLEQKLAAKHPDFYTPRYELVSFHTSSYTHAQETGRWQQRLLHQVCNGKKVLSDADFAHAEQLLQAQQLRPGAST